jgi:tetratricopeptide (TPR) repeat protein
MAAKNSGLEEDAQRSYREAQGFFDESMRIKQELAREGKQQEKWEKEIAWTMLETGEVKEGLEQYEEARQLYEQSLDRMNRYRDQRGIAANMHNLGRLARQKGDTESARSHYEKSLEINRGLGIPRAIAGDLRGLAAVAEQQGDDTRAGRLYLQALSILRRLGIPDAEVVEQCLAQVRERLGQDAYDTL